MRGWEGVSQSSALGVLQAARISAGPRTVCQRWGVGGLWGPYPSMSALEPSRRRDLIQQMALDREGFWEWRRGSVGG